MKIPIVGPSYTLESRSFDCQRTVNLYPEVSESGTSKEQARLVGTPGLEYFTNLGTLPCRASTTTAAGRCFFVCGDTLWEIVGGGVTTNRGTLNTAAGRVGLAENGSQLMLVDGTNGYIFTYGTNAFVEISDAEYPDTAQVVVYMDTYFIVNEPGTGKFYISANNDGTSWAALDFTTAEARPDSVVSLLVDHGELFVLGSRSVEVYLNTGNPAFPFERVSPSAVMQTGCAAAFSVQSFDNNVVWVGTDEYGRGVVWQTTDAYRPVKISTQAVETALASVPSLVDAYSWVYHQRGHAFYVLQVPGLASTWVYDASTKLWHERGFWNPEYDRDELHLGVCHAFFNQMTLVGDRRNGNVYRMRLDHYQDDGGVIRRIRRTPHISNEMKRIFFHSVHLDMETGVGLVSGQGEDPQVMMKYSDDGGRTWSNEKWKSFGKMGEYNRRARWAGLGSSRDRVFEFLITDPVPISINGCYAEVSMGNN